MQPPSDGRAEVDEEAEAEALGRIVLAFRGYRQDAELEVARWEHNFGLLPPHHQQLLGPRQLLKFSTARQCIQVNSFFIASMLATFEEDEEGGGPPSHLAKANRAADAVAAKAGHRPSFEDYGKVLYVLKNLARDWSVEGAAERAACYGPILAELRALFSDWPEGHEPPSVLLPGCGLARLCCEVAGLGFQAQGNEFSYHMLLTSSFILNQVHEANQYTIFPWMHSNCNQFSNAQQLRAVSLPDVAPADLVAAPGLLSMCAGDFVEVYARPEWADHFDCVVTCFFIDTAHNVVQYVEVIRHCLKEGGYWLNLGPLLYHWADASRSDELSIELSLEDVVAVAHQLGFRTLKQATLQAPYIANFQSMYQTMYQACMWTMVKDGSSSQAGVQTLHAQPPPPPPPTRNQQQDQQQQQQQHSCPETRPEAQLTDPST